VTPEEADTPGSLVFQAPTGAVDQPRPEPEPPKKTPAEQYLERQAVIDAELLALRSSCLFYAGIAVPLLVFFGVQYHTQGQYDWLEYASGALLYGTIIIFFGVWQDELIHLLRPPRERAGHVWIVAVLAPVGTACAIIACLAGLRAIGLSFEEPPLADFELPIWFNYLWVCLLPAVLEEIAFRGILFTRMSRLMGPKHAAWVVAMMFGILHLNVIGMAVFLIPISLLASWMIVKTRSLLPAMLLHFLHNAIVLTLDYVS
jgi:uncharacterized protein